MASPHDPGDWTKRYEVIEKAYCQGRWSTVMEAGTLLLRELLQEESEPEVMALRHRMQLLMAHTLLHGYGDRDAAEDLYVVVQQSAAEAALRQIAEDGLDQCHQPLTSSLTVQEDEEEESQVRARPMLFLPDQERTDLGEAPGLRQPAQAPFPSSQMPRNPLPASTPEAKPEPAEAPTPTVPAGATLGVAADPFEPSGGTAQTAPQQGDAPVMPWLSQPSAAGLQEPAREAGQSSLPWQASTPAPPSLSSQALIPEVVDEPELIELHQATPSLAEEVDLQIEPPSPATAPIPAPEEDLTPVVLDDAEAEELRTGLLLVMVGG
jgi:hypothetical protein